MKICKVCGKEHDGSYGSGKFCSKHCRYIYIGRKSAKSEKHQEALKVNRKKCKNRSPFGTWKCKFCNLIFETKKELYLHLHAEHQDLMGKFRNKGGTAWNKGKTKETDERLLKAGIILHNRYKNGDLKPSWIGRKHSEETKKKISESRKSYLKNNPDKHPWKKLSKFKSEPCERLKQVLKDYQLKFIEEFSDEKWTHNYSIDIAFPEKKIAIEVNGNQHYNNDGTLKEYYVNREEYLKSFGWTIYQLHYSLVYNDQIVSDLIKKII